MKQTIAWLQWVNTYRFFNVDYHLADNTSVTSFRLTLIKEYHGQAR